MWPQLVVCYTPLTTALGLRSPRITQLLGLILLGAAGVFARLAGANPISRPIVQAVASVNAVSALALGLLLLRRTPPTVAGRQITGAVSVALTVFAGLELRGLQH